MRTNRIWSGVLALVGCVVIGIERPDGAFTASNGPIALTSHRDGDGEIYVMAADGTGLTKLTDNVVDDDAPAWSPDGARIAFQTTRDGGSHEIYVMHADGSGPTRLTNHPALDASPAWSPDGSRVAFVSNRSGSYDVYVMNADGGGVTRLTSHGANDLEPAWSPDGSKIAFRSERDGNAEIYVMNADGSSQTRLTSHAAFDDLPAWSPDGSRIAFHSSRDSGNYEIYVMNADGTFPTRLTFNGAGNRFPDWSPDGRQIVFGSARDGNWEIYTMQADGSAPTRLTNHPALEVFAAWGAASVVDADGDGVADAADNCPAVANAGQADGDGDGAGDACDTDDDGDGVDDANDAFPLNPSEWVDTDSDGTGNHADTCPLDPANDADADGICANAVAHGAAFAYVGNFNSHTVSVVDTITRTVAATIPVSGPCAGTATRPLGVAVHPSGRRIYVAAVGNFLRGCAGVSVIDAVTRTQIATIAMSGPGEALCGVHGIALNREGTRLYVATVPQCGGGPGPVRLVEVDTATHSVRATAAVGSGVVTGIALNPAGTEAYLASGNGNVVFVVDVATHAVVQVPVERFPYGIALNPAGTRAYVGNIDSKSVSVIDTAAKTVIDTIPVPSGASALAVNASGTRLYAASSGAVPAGGQIHDDVVAVLDIGNDAHAVIGTIPVGGGPSGVALNPAGTLAFVPNVLSDTVSVIDTDADVVIATVGVGANPQTYGQFVGPAATGDNCPLAANADQTDTDGDGDGNACDADDDNDGVLDPVDAFPLDASETVDTDGDDVGNNADPDDDNDGMPDGTDPFPLDAANVHPLYVVDSPADLPDAAPGNGICATATGVCTLRAAVQETSALAGPDAIAFAPGMDGSPITLTVTGAGEDAAATGDLDVIGSLTITGNGVDETIVQGCEAQTDPACVGGDRLFDVLDGASLTMSGVTLRNGFWGINVGVRQPWESGYGGRATLILSAAAILNHPGPGITSIGDVTITHARLAGNREHAILASPGTTLRIVGSTISDNAAHAGGAIFTNSGSAVTSFTITDTTFANNTATYDGGAISVNGGGPYRISNTTFSGNRVVGSDPVVGGAALFAAAPVQLASVTFSGNHSGTIGGAMHAYGANVTLTHSIVEDSGGGNCAATRGGAITSLGYNLVDDASCGASAGGDLRAAAALGPLQDNGGPTPTHLPLGTSPVVDAGDPAGCTDAAGAALATDQRGVGFPRAHDGDNDGVDRCDIGAVEGVRLLLDTDHDGVPDHSDADDDGDGIEDAVDVESLTASSAFDDTPNGGQTAGIQLGSPAIRDMNPGGVRATAGGSPATLSTCSSGGYELIALPPGHMAAIECFGSTTQLVAAFPNPAAVTMQAGEVLAHVPPGQWVEMGSPVTAGASNTEDIHVSVVDLTGAVIGSFALEPGESVKAQLAGAPGEPVLRIEVLVGDVDVTAFGRTVRIAQGSQVSLTPVPTIDELLSDVAALQASPGVTRALTVTLRAAQRALERGNARAGRLILNAFVMELRALKRSRRVDAEKVDALIADAHAVIASL